MKYTDLKIKNRLSQGEYISLVDSMVNIQLLKNEDGSIEYHPEFLTTTLPSIIVGFCIDGIEFENEETLYDVDFINKIMSDDMLSSVVNYIMYGSAVNKVPTIKYYQPAYFRHAVNDAKLIVEQRLRDNSPAKRLLECINAFMTGFIDGVKNEDISGLLKKTIEENIKDKKLN